MDKKRKEGYYWTFGNKCFEIKNWSIYYWDGNYFWNGNEDFSEDSFEIIDETEIKRDSKSHSFCENKILKEIAEKMSEKHHYAFAQQSEFYQLGFLEGVKWQVEKMYKE